MADVCVLQTDPQTTIGFFLQIGLNAVVGIQGDVSGVFVDGHGRRYSP
jgi:hypothetical protein